MKCLPFLSTPQNNLTPQQEMGGGGAIIPARTGLYVYFCSVKRLHKQCICPLPTVTFHRRIIFFMEKEMKRFYFKG
jgi:hypothetical protein